MGTTTHRLYLTYRAYYLYQVCALELELFNLIQFMSSNNVSFNASETLNSLCAKEIGDVCMQASLKIWNTSMLAYIMYNSNFAG